MIETYNTWNHHGEQLDKASSSRATRVDNVETVLDPNEQVMDIINDAFPFASTNINQEEEDDMPTPIDNAEFEQYEKLLKNANQELYPGRKAVSTGQSSPPPTQPTAITAPAQMEQLSRDPPASHAPASSASSVAQPLSARRCHRPPSMRDTTSTDGTGASGSQPAKKNTRGPCRQLKTAKVTRVTNSRISIGYDARHRATPTAELHSSLAHDVGHIVRTYCPMQWKSWKVMPEEMRTEVLGQLSKAAKANKGNRNKKTLLHHSGSRPFSYRMEARRWGGSKFLVLHESASQLPPETPLESVDPSQDVGFQILTETLDQTLGRRLGTYCRGMGNARRWKPVGPSSSQSNQVTALTAEVAELKIQLASYST
ncbi:unnamed protein product [Prunus brigantina]